VRLQDLVYAVYERRLARQLGTTGRPRHVAVIMDGNRRWAKEAGFADVSDGHRVGAAKLLELLGWCRETGVEIATFWLLSPDNLHNRPPDQLQPLLEIIADVVDELCAADTPWRVRVVGALDLLPPDMAQRLTSAAARTRPRQAPAWRNSLRYSTSSRSPSTSTPPANPTLTWSSAPLGSNGSQVSCSGSRRIQSSGFAMPTGRPFGRWTSCVRYATTQRDTAGSDPELVRSLGSSDRALSSPP
jgi:hypothetical protein